MDRYIRVPKVIDLIGKIVFLLLYSTLFMQFSIVNSNQWLLFILGIIFAYMMIEDYREQTVDMRIFIILFAIMFWINGWDKAFLIQFSAGLIIFRSFYLLALRVEEVKCRKKSDNDANEQLSIGFLPSIGVSIIFFSFIRNDLNFNDVNIWMGIHQQLILLIILANIWIYMEYKLQVRKNDNELLIQEGIGMGDVWILSAWFAFFSFLNFTAILFCSLCIHAMGYGLYFFKNKIRGGTL